MNQRILEVLLFLLSSICRAANSAERWTNPWSAYSQPAGLGELREFDREYNGLPYAFNSPQNISPSSQQRSYAGPANPYKFIPVKNGAHPNNLQGRYVNPASQHITVHHGNTRPQPQQPYAPNYMQAYANHQKYHIPKAPAKYPIAQVKYPNGPLQYGQGPVKQQNAPIQYQNAQSKYPNGQKQYANVPVIQPTSYAPFQYANGQTRYTSLPVKYPNGPTQQSNTQLQYPKALGNSPALKSTASPYPYPINGLGQQHYTAFKPYAAAKTYGNQFNEDPTLKKIISDVNANEIRLKKNEEVPRNHPSESQDDDERAYKNIHRNQEHENHVPQYENYYPETKPTYYKKPVNPPPSYQNLNKYAVYPRPNFENIKVHPNAFQPLKYKISELKKAQGNHFGHENNEYPANRPDDEEEDYENEGRDIFDHQKKAFDNQNTNFNQDFNQFTNRHHPNAPTLPTSLDYSDDDSKDDVSFIPVKMYAQVRHVETTKHLPRESAYDDAVTYDDLINAPRLREAIKTSKAQIVYSEEGYEDGAYDHAGHTKEASNHEGHGGFAKSKHYGADLHKNSGVKSNTDAGRSEGGRDEASGKTWSNDEENSEDFDDEESYDDHDLTEAGSEKKHSRNTSNTPIKYFKEKKKLVMSGSVEKRYEDVAKPTSEDRKKENESYKPKRHNSDQEFVGAHLRKALEFNYGPEIWNIDKKQKKNNDKFLTPSDVEVFSSDIKADEGPKHGGNYRHIDSIDQSPKSKTFSKRHGISKNVKKPNIVTSGSFVAGDSNEPTKLSGYQEGEDLFDLFGDTSDPPRRYSEKFLQVPEEYGNSYRRKDSGLSPQASSVSKEDQFPITSEVEVFGSEFKRNRGPKHGGNYKKYSGKEKKKIKQEEASELDDLNSSHDSSGGYLHGGNYRTA